MSEGQPARRGFRRGRWWAYIDRPEIWYDDKPFPLPGPMRSKALSFLIARGRIQKNTLRIICQTTPGSLAVTLSIIRTRLPAGSGIALVDGWYVFTYPKEEPILCPNP